MCRVKVAKHWASLRFNRCTYWNTLCNPGRKPILSLLRYTFWLYCETWWPYSIHRLHDSARYWHCLANTFFEMSINKPEPTQPQCNVLMTFFTFWHWHLTSVSPTCQNNRLNIFTKDFYLCLATVLFQRWYHINIYR